MSTESSDFTEWTTRTELCVAYVPKAFPNVLATHQDALSRPPARECVPSTGVCPQQGFQALNCYSWASLYVHTARQQVTAWTSESMRQIPRLCPGKRLPSFPGTLWSQFHSVFSVGDLTFIHYCSKEPCLPSSRLYYFIPTLHVIQC